MRLYTTYDNWATLAMRILVRESVISTYRCCACSRDVCFDNSPPWRRPADFVPALQEQRCRARLLAGGLSAWAVGVWVALLA